MGHDGPIRYPRIAQFTSPKQFLTGWLEKKGFKAVFEYGPRERSGMFTCEVRASDFPYRGQGVARTKKAAAQEAATDFIGYICGERLLERSEQAALTNLRERLGAPGVLRTASVRPGIQLPAANDPNVTVDGERNVVPISPMPSGRKVAGADRTEMGVLDVLRGPRLHSNFYTTAPRDVNWVETASDAMFTTFRGAYSFLTGFYPILVIYVYSKGMLSPSYFRFYIQYAAVFGTLAYSTRLFGRMLDVEYRQFLDVWMKAKTSQRSEDIRQLKQFDFEIANGPVDFVAKPMANPWYLQPSPDDAQGNIFTKGFAWFCVHSFGRRMLYPGSVGLLNYFLDGTIRENRRLMITQKNGSRIWLKTTENDTIDAMYIDATKENAERGRTLVICCEGNAGFYELGIANTPAQLGYSVLGWNTPGFAESTGVPLPKNVYAAADAVMQYALGPLGYKPENIVLFGWSIGGFPASWLAANYPQARALILDATFDDLLPLAQSRMPSVAANVVKYAVRNHLNLQIDQQVHRYKGALRLIRRLQEEIILTDENGTEEERRASNRANALLKSVLEDRHPDIVKGLLPQVDRWLAMSPEQRILAGTALQSGEEAHRIKRLFNLCDHYFVDFDATHVTPLSPLYFNIPSPMLGR